MKNDIKLGDFTGLAKAYINRPAYSKKIIIAILRYANLDISNIKVADIGAENWNKIYSMIEESVKGLNEIVIPYKMRAWTVKKI